MRCNAGVPPSALLDQHLIAEYRELLIPFGQLRSLNFQSKSQAPEHLKLGKGHIVFWRDKQLYLRRRHQGLVTEMKARGFKPQYFFWDLDEIPEPFLNDWEPTREDSLLLRRRIAEKVMLKPTWYRHTGRNLVEPQGYLERLFDAPVEL